MRRVNMTARWVESVKPPATQQIDYWDDSLPGFSLRLTSTGRKTWTVYYRFHGRKRRVSLGTYPSVSLADARTRAREVFSKVSSGVDPAAEKLLLRNAGTFAELATEYFNKHAKRKKSRRQDRWMIDRHLLPRWEHVKARDISRPDVRALIESIADTGRGVLANRVLALVSKMFSFAVSRDWREDNPCKGVERAVIERPRERVLNADEIRAVWTALDSDDPFFQALFKLRLLTAARGGELRHMRWADVNVGAGWWTIPREFSKNDEPHRVPLSQPAVELLNALHVHQQQRLETINDGRRKKRLAPKEPSEWVFPSPRGDDQPFDWEQRAAARLRRTSGIDFRPHDLRRTAATALTEHCGVDRFLLKKILNHVDRDITGVYDRNRYDAQKRGALDTLARYLKAVIEGKDKETNVVPISVGRK